MKWGTTRNPQLRVISRSWVRACALANPSIGCDEFQNIALAHELIDFRKADVCRWQRMRYNDGSENASLLSKGNLPLLGAKVSGTYRETSKMS